MRERRRVSTSARNAIANTRILTARDTSEIYLAAILRRGYPRRIVRAIDGSSIGGSRGISGWVLRSARRVRMHARASHVRNGLLDARGIRARVRCNEGDNGHYYRRVTSRGACQSRTFVATLSRTREDCFYGGACEYVSRKTRKVTLLSVGRIWPGGFLVARGKCKPPSPRTFAKQSEDVERKCDKILIILPGAVLKNKHTNFVISA